MVGDSYFYNYLALKEGRIDASFIENVVAKMPDPVPQGVQSIKEVVDLLSMLD